MWTAPFGKGFVRLACLYIPEPVESVPVVRHLDVVIWADVTRDQVERTSLRVHGLVVGTAKSIETHQLREPVLRPESERNH